MYNAGELQDATDRLRGVPGLFTSVNMTPTGDDPESRDSLVEVTEARTANLNIARALIPTAAWVETSPTSKGTLTSPIGRALERLL